MLDHTFKRVGAPGIALPSRLSLDDARLGASHQRKKKMRSCHSAAASFVGLFVTSAIADIT
jgi:hypothetical protein